MTAITVLIIFYYYDVMIFNFSCVHSIHFCVVIMKLFIGFFQINDNYSE